MDSSTNDRDETDAGARSLQTFVGLQRWKRRAERNRKLATELQTAAAFLPNRLLTMLHEHDVQRALRERKEPSEDWSKPFGGIRRQFTGTLVFFDMSGFTKLSEALVNKGKTFLANLHRQAPTLIHSLGAAGVNLGKVSSHAAGAEALQESLTEYFGGIIEKVVQYGGDVIRIAGDAIITVFPDSTVRD
eukprot:SAG31_NODE_1742_length_7385_cov_40.678836_8_plen_189_part_00